MQAVKEEGISRLEEERIKVLRKYKVLDTPPDGHFDDITQLASEVLDMPIAIVSLVDKDRIWFKSKHGLDVQEIDRDPGLCASAILSDDLYLIEDAKKDLRALANPLVSGEFGLRFYAAVPLCTSEGFNLGTLCVIDKKPRKFSKAQEKILTKLAGLVMHQMELRLEARTAIKYQHQLMDITAHDLKNPLSILPLMADMILQNKSKPDAIEGLANQLKDAGKRMTKTITDLLETSRKDAGKVKLRLKSLDLEKLVERVVASNKTLARKKYQEIYLLVEHSCLVFGDAQRLTEVVDNLINNAIKYSPHGTSINVGIGAKEEEGKAVITVQDEGQGLTSNDMENLFRKFTSLSAQPTGGENSTGLGLSIVKSLVEAHKGKISAESAGLGKGSTFIVELPLSQD